MKFIVLCLAIIFSGLAHARHCFQQSEQHIITTLQKALKQENLWDGFNIKKVPVALRTNDLSTIILLNLDQEFLKQSQISFQACTENPTALQLDIGPDFPTIPNGFYNFIFPGNSTHQIISTLAALLKHPILIFSIAEPTGSKFPANDLARILIHESFHMAHQFFGEFDMSEASQHPRDFYETCKTNEAWLENLDTELQILKNIRDNWVQYSDDKILVEAQKAIRLRNNFIFANPDDTCYSHLNFWERVEGSAHYIDLVTGLNLGAYESFPANGDPRNSFFYHTGATYSILLLRFFPKENWQSRINSGLGPAEVLKDLL
jgi:hypothetical protein